MCLTGASGFMVAGSQVVTPTAKNVIVWRNSHKSINKNRVLTTFMLKKRSFILPLCQKSLRGRCFAMRKKSEKMMGWTVSPLKKSRADSVLPGRPLFCISASLSPQRCFFYFSINSLKSELNARLLSFSFSPWRILFRAFSEPSRTHLRGNSTFLSGRDH